MAVRQTACRWCGLDIEGFSPYRKGEWRDRGNNTDCPTREGEHERVHAPVIDQVRYRSIKLGSVVAGGDDDPDWGI